MYHNSLLALTVWTKAITSFACFESEYNTTSPFRSIRHHTNALMNKVRNKETNE